MKDCEGLIQTIIKKPGLNIQVFKTGFEHEVKKNLKIEGSGFGQVYLSDQSQELINRAMKKAGEFKDEYISTEHLLLAIFKQDVATPEKY